MSETTEAVRERPILFSGPMVRAILDGTKTQTRRVVKGKALEWLAPGMFTPAFVASPDNHLSPYGAPGDRLWVRETWASSGGSVIYKADEFLAAGAYESVRWRPSIHMPRWASRLTLQVTDVRVERLQDISEDDARAEGAELLSEDGMSGWGHTDESSPTCYTRRNGFYHRWDSINAKRGHGWDTNPWVWVVSFERVA